MSDDLKKAYRTILADHFPERMEITFVSNEKRSTLLYDKVSWEIDGVRRGLRYGENPGQAQPAGTHQECPEGGDGVARDGGENVFHEGAHPQGKVEKEIG